MVPVHKRNDHNYMYISTVREARIELFRVINRLDKHKNGVISEFFCNKILEYCAKLSLHIRIAHDIYVITDMDYKIRRKYQHEAIGYTHLILEEIVNLFEIYPDEVSNFEKICNLLNKEVTLLKGWRKSTDKVFKKIKEGEKLTKEDKKEKNTPSTELDEKK